MRLHLSILTMWLLFSTAPSVMSAPSRPGGLPDDVNPGELKVLNIAGKTPERALQLPLRHTDVQISISGFVARATVTQHYTNPFEAPIEAIYVFPLPNKAAVDGMTMQVGEKIIRGIIKRREEARKIYEQAKAAGQRTGLLEQERPNIFTQSVGNIMPGDEIRIEISYVDILDYRDQGAYELVFPMVVGPRYIPGSATGKSGPGWAPDTDQVPDASLITPPVLKPGERSGHDISLKVKLDAAVTIHGVQSVSHAVDIEEISSSQRTIALHASETLPNKDFILRYEVAGKAPEMALITHHTEARGGFFTFIMLPQQQVTDTETVARDLIFILDTSGSMRGFPMAKSKEAMDRLMDGMRASDRFNIVRFAADTGTLWPAPRPKSPENVRAARRFIEGLRGSGGTEMRQGIIEALAQPADPDRLRIAFLLTDGYVGNEAGILHSIEKERRGARVFTLGVGSAVNRYLLDRAAIVGRGEAFYIRQDEPATGLIERFFKRVDRPALAHIEIDWGGLEVSELRPPQIPDLWQGQPIQIHGRYAQGGEARIRIRGLLGKTPFERHLNIVLPENQPGNALMATVWARAKVKELMLGMARFGEKPDLVEEITELGLNYRIMTQWTSFVAVEEKVVNVGGELQTILQPVELPEGVDYEGVFGDFSEESRVRRGALAPLLRGLAPSSAPMYRLGAAPAMESAERKDYGRREAQPVMEEAKEKSASTRCRRSALSVSGGLKLPEVERRLQDSWDVLCRALSGKYSGEIVIAIEVAVNPDGSVKTVTLRPKAPVANDVTKSLRRWFRDLDFGAVRGGGGATIKFQLRLR